MILGADGARFGASSWLGYYRGVYKCQLKDDYGTISLLASASIQISDLRMEKLQKIGKIALFSSNVLNMG